MKSKFICSLCKKEVKRGEKSRVEINQYYDESSLSGVFCEDGICNKCADRVEAKIDSMRK